MPFFIHKGVLMSEERSAETTEENVKNNEQPDCDDVSKQETSAEQSGDCDGTPAPDPDQEDSEEDSQEEQMTLEDLVTMMADREDNKPSLESMRTVGLYGDVEEEKIAEVIAGLLSLHHLGSHSLK